jgi:PAS domain S-box-containing protein
MWVFDSATLRFLAVNQAALDLYGYTREEFLSLTPLDLRPLEEHDKFRAHMATVDPTGVNRARWQHITKDGALLAVEVSAQGITFDGRAARLIVVDDFTPVSAAEAARQESEARYKTLIEHAPDAIVVLDVDAGTFIEANENASRLFGCTREELLSLGVADVSPPSQPDGRSSVEAASEVIERALRGETPVFEWLHRSVSGEEILCEVRLVRLPSASRRLVRGSMTDIRERKAAEIEASRLGAIVEFSQDAMIATDFAGRIITWNRGAERLFGYSAYEVLGRTTERFFLPGEEHERARIRETVIGRGESIEGLERTWLRKDGTTVTTSSSYFPIRDPDGNITGVGSVARGISDRKSAELALRASEARLRLALRASRLGIWAWDTETNAIDWSPEAAAILGRTLGEMPPTIGATLRLIHPEDTPRTRVVSREDLASGAPIDFRMVLPSGDYRWVSVTGMRAPDGRQVTGVIRDIHESKLAEAELRESESRIRELLENLSTAVWVSDGRAALLVNGELERVTGYPREQLLREGFLASLIHPDDRQAMVDHLQRRLRGEERVSRFEIRITRADGETRYLAVSASAFSFAGVSASLLSAFDVTERRRAEDELRESEQRFRSLADSAPIFIWTARPDRQIDFFNATWRNFTGRPMEVDTGYGWTEVIHPEDLDATVATYEAKFDARAPYSMRYRLRRHDGQYRWILEHGTPRYAGDWTFLGFIGACLDIHETVLAEDEIRASEERFRSLVETVPVGIWAWDGVDVLMVNAALERLLGFSREQLTRRDFLGSRIDPEDRARIRARAARRMAGEPVDPPYVEIRINDARDRVLTFELHSTVVTLGGQRIWLNSVIDVTERRAAEEERRRLDHQMQQTQKLESLGILAGGIAHDFNNLLVAILGNAGLALLELPPESPARQTVQAIETAAQRAADLTRQMLAYSGKGKFVIEPLNLSRVVEEMAHLLEVSVSKRAVLKYHFAPNLPPIEADATQVRQVIMNLITNASDAIGDRSGVISISTGMQHCDRAYLRASYLDADLPEGDYVYIEVADTGEGMDEATRARIFDPFFTTKFTGRGLGLAAVLGIVRGHRAAIKLYSEPGRGTTFKVLFPAARLSGARAPEPAPRPEPRAATGPRATVLVVDDDETVRTVTRRILERSGFTVLLAPDGLRALETYRATPDIALVILDMTMPHMDGEECFRELRHLDPAVRVLLTSGYNEQDATERFVGKGLAGFIQKPYRPADLLTRVEEVLSQSRG